MNSSWSCMNISYCIHRAVQLGSLHTHNLHSAKVNEEAKGINSLRMQCIYGRQAQRFLRQLWGWDPSLTDTQAGQLSEGFAAQPHMHPPQTQPPYPSAQTHCPYKNHIRLKMYTKPFSSVRCSDPGTQRNATEQCLDGESDVFAMCVPVVKLQKGNLCKLTSRTYLLI